MSSHQFRGRCRARGRHPSERVDSPAPEKVTPALSALHPHPRKGEASSAGVDLCPLHLSRMERRPAVGMRWLWGQEGVWPSPGHLFPQPLPWFPVLFPILTAALFVLSFFALLLSLGNGGACPVSSPEPGLPCRSLLPLRWFSCIFVCVLFGVSSTGPVGCKKNLGERMCSTLSIIIVF